MPRSLALRPGCAYSFEYPRYNYDGLPSQTERRRIVVESVRDIHREPLDPTTVSVNPTLRRGRWLITGRDLDRDDTRSFYADSMTEIKPLSDEEREPMRNANYVVLSPVGQTAFKATRLSEAIAYLLGRRSGILCHVLGFSSDQTNDQTTA